MMIKFSKFISATCVVLLSTLAIPQASAQESWTHIGSYLFAASLEGTSEVRNITSDVDVSFSDVIDDIIDNLDFGAVGFIEHRNGPWSFIGDAIYLKISGDDILSTNGILTISLDAELEQTIAEGFVGYRVFEQESPDSNFGIDLLGGARYIRMKVDLGGQATLLGLTTAGSRSLDESWTDGVIGTRLQYTHDSGWGLSGWADIGKGSDSSSYQLIGMVNYLFDNNVSIIGGYRFLNMDYETGSGVTRFAIDLDYSGPLLGVSYKF